MNHGEALTYYDVHYRLKRDRGLASSQLCKCGKPAEQWAYQHTGETRIDEHGRTYSNDVCDYEAMCRSCHNKLDQEQGRRKGQLDAARLRSCEPEAVSKVVAVHKGSKRTPEQKERIRQGALRRWELARLETS